MSSMSKSSVHTSQASHDTTAALAESEATSPKIAGDIRKQASMEHDAAEEVAHIAQNVGETLTGNPGGDTTSDKDMPGGVKGTLHSIEEAAFAAAKKPGEVLEAAREFVGSSTNEIVDPPPSQPGQDPGIVASVTNMASSAVHLAMDTMGLPLHKAVETAQNYLGFGAQQPESNESNRPAGQN